MKTKITSWSLAFVFSSIERNRNSKYIKIHSNWFSKYSTYYWINYKMSN